MPATVAVRNAIAYEVCHEQFEKRWVDRISDVNRVAELLYAALRAGTNITVKAITRGTQTRPLTAEEARRIVDCARDLAVAARRDS